MFSDYTRALPRRMVAKIIPGNDSRDGKTPELREGQQCLLSPQGLTRLQLEIIHVSR